jgi:hypothetical protein
LKPSARPSKGCAPPLQLSLIKAHEQAKGVLSPEQRQKLECLYDRLPGMMGEPGTGGMGMMGMGAWG